MEKTIDLLNRLITKGQQVVDEARVIRDDLLKLQEGKIMKRLILFILLLIISLIAGIGVSMMCLFLYVLFDN